MGRQTIFDDDFAVSPYDIPFNYSYSFLNLLKIPEAPVTAVTIEPSVSVVALAALSLSLASCGGDSQTATTPIPITQPTAAPAYNPTPKYNFQSITSSAVSIKNILIGGEALTVADINGDGKKDLILSNAGDGTYQGAAASNAILQTLRPTDGKTTIFLNNGDNTFSLLDTQNIRVTGWVNDWVVLPNPNGGNPYIVGIDHGREDGGVNNHTNWKSTLPVFQIQNGKLVDLSDAVPSHLAKFYHNSSNYGDLNNDGIMDFVTANLDGFSIFYGDKTAIFKDVTNSVLGAGNTYNTIGSKSFVGNTGTAVIVDVGGDGQKDVVLLPYHTYESGGVVDCTYADVFKFQGGQFQGSYSFLAKNNQIPVNYGFSSAKVADINNDGLDDIVGMMEANTGSNQRIFTIMLQNKQGTFDVSYIEQNGSIMLGPGDQSQYRTDAKFELFDIDNDGKLDIYMNMLWGTNNDKSQGIYFGDGTGKFVANDALANQVFSGIDLSGGNARTIMADFNDDGRPDLLAFKVSCDQFGNPVAVTPNVFINASSIMTTAMLTETVVPSKPSTGMALPNLASLFDSTPGEHTSFAVADTYSYATNFNNSYQYVDYFNFA